MCAEDVRRALGIRHDYPTGAVVELAGLFKGSNMLIGAKRRIEGLALRVTDASWSHGSGPEVTGPALSLLMATTGRKAVLDELSVTGWQSCAAATDGKTRLRARTESGTLG